MPHLVDGQGGKTESRGFVLIGVLACPARPARPGATEPGAKPALVLTLELTFYN